MLGRPAPSVKRITVILIIAQIMLLTGLSLGEVIVSPIGEWNYLAEGSKIAGNYAYLSDPNGGLRILDISDPTSPSLVGQVTGLGQVYDVAISGNYAYLASRARGLDIVDISNPAAPFPAGNYDVEQVDVTGVDVQGNYVYICGEDNYYHYFLKILNISNPTSPSLVGNFRDLPDHWDLDVEGNYAYITAWEFGLQIVNISNPSAPTLAGGYDTPGDAWDITIHDNHAYIADGGGGLQIVNVSNPAAPFLAGNFGTPGDALAVDVDGHYACVSSVVGNFQVINIADPSNPRLAGSSTISGYSHNMVMDGSLVLSGMKVFRLLPAIDFPGGQTVDTVDMIDREIRVLVSEGPDPAQGMFFYRPGGATAYESAPMQVSGGDTLLFNISADLLTIRGFEYYLTINRNILSTSIGLADNPYTFVTRMLNSQAQRPTSIPAGQYRITGLPVDILDIPGANSVTEVFDDDIDLPYKTHWRLGDYQSEVDSIIEYPESSPVRPGQGYWLSLREERTYGAGGLSVYPDRTIEGIAYYAIPLGSGWNQMANPFPFDISWDEIRFEDNGTVVDGHPADVIEDVAYWYDGTGYTAVDIIPAWEGVFVRTVKSGVIALVRYHEVESLKTPSKEAIPQAEKCPPVWQIHLRLESSGLIDQGNFVGVYHDALDEPDRHDYSEPPPPPGGPCLAFRIPGEDDSKHLYRTDFRSPLKEPAAWDIVLSPAPDRILTLDNINDLPADRQAWLILSDNSEIMLKDNDGIVLPDDVVSARLYVGAEEQLREYESLIKPDRFILKQNHPNPFNAVTNIEFSLPAREPVRLDIVNIRGQTITTLIDHELPPGHHQASWNGRDRNDQPVASGVYFCRIRAGDFVDSRKMMMVK